MHGKIFFKLLFHWVTVALTNPLSASPTKCQTHWKLLPTNFLIVFDHFVGLTLKGLKSAFHNLVWFLPIHEKIWLRELKLHRKGKWNVWYGAFIKITFISLFTITFAADLCFSQTNDPVIFCIITVLESCESNYRNIWVIHLNDYILKSSFLIESHFSKELRAHDRK